MPAPAYHPQLARLVKAAPEGDGWLHEMKYDGYRIGCRIDGTKVRLISRNGKDWTAAFPEIADAAKRLGVRHALLDGEAAIVLRDGRTSFQALQNLSGGGGRRNLVYFVFDLLYFDGTSLVRQPLEARKKTLLDLVGKPRARARIRYSEHVVGRGPELFAEACRSGLEGIISKRRDATYKSGRTDSWLKTKCILRQEFVVGGFTEPEGAREGIGSLVIGHYEDDRLVFAGKVGTGFTVASARDLRRRLEEIEQKDSPFTPPPAGWLGRHAHWTKPLLVAEVVFTEWTEEGKIRHPSFQGLRADKKARDVRRERAEAPPPVPSKLGGRAAARRSAGQRRAGLPPRVNVAGVGISNPDRVLYPDPKITKLDLAKYYERIADWIVPHVEGRPLTLVRCPEGVRGECFYMKHSKIWAPPALRRVRVQEKTKVGDYLVADNPSAIVSLVQMGVMEIHTWNSHIGTVDLPDRIVLDIDPGEHVAWRSIIATARLVRRILHGVDLDSFVKTTGGKGLHVVAPLAPKVGWKECLEFSRAVAEAIVRHDAALYTTAFAKAGRERKILIDYLRNNRTNTSIAAFSSRARAGAPVSVPVKWDEVAPSLDPEALTVTTVENRLARLRQDPWKDYWKSKQRLPRAAAAAIRAL
jgi:bifunctional non-homologous end joining protein LigD